MSRVLARSSIHNGLQLPRSTKLRAVTTAAHYRPQERPIEYVSAEIQLAEAEYQELELSQLDHSDAHLQSIGHANVVLLRRLLSRDRTRRVVLKSPELLKAPLATWLEFLSAYGFQETDFACIVEAKPNVFVNSSVYSAGQVLGYLQSLGLQPDQVVSIVSKRWPAILTVVVSEQMQPVVHYLQQLGCDSVVLKRMVCKQPRWLCYSVDRELKPKVAALQAAGLTGAEISRVVPECIEAFLFEPAEVLAAKLCFLRESGFQQQQLSQLLLGCPKVLGNSVASLRDRWQFLTEIIGGHVQDVLMFPEYLDTDLMCTIRPRYFYVREHRLQHRLTSSDSSCISLSLLLGQNDNDFQTALGITRTQYLEYYNELVSLQHYGVKFEVNLSSKQL